MFVTLTIVGAAALVIVVGLAIYYTIPFPYPGPTESDYSHHRSPWWQLYYTHKYVRPKKRAEKGSGLESHFRAQSFAFDSEPPLQNVRSLVLSSAGDLMVHKRLTNGGGAHLWDDVGEELFTADIVTGNLEFAVNEDWFIFKTLRYSIPPSYAEPLLGDPRFGAVDYVSLGNNHMNDSLSGGIRSTCEYLDGLNIRRSGANRTAAEQDEFPIFEISGAKIAMLSYSFSTNNIPLDSEMPYGVNVIRFNALRDEDYDDSLILHHVDLAKQRGANFIVSHHHWGLDLEHYPPKRIVDRAHRLMEYGVDMIIGHHPHVVGPSERYQTKDGRECLCFYSLGSLTTCCLIFAIQRLSLIAKTTLEVGEDARGVTRVRPKKIAMVPVYYSLGGRKDGPRLLALEPSMKSIERGEPLPHLTKSEIRRIKSLHSFLESHFVQAGIEYR